MVWVNPFDTYLGLFGQQQSLYLGLSRRDAKGQVIKLSFALNVSTVCFLTSERSHYLLGLDCSVLWNPVEMADREYQKFNHVNQDNRGTGWPHISPDRQETSLKKLDKIKMKGWVDSLKLAKELRLSLLRQQVKLTTRQLLWLLELIEEHGSGAWLTQFNS